MSDSLSTNTTERGRIKRNAMQANRPDWMRWLPGLETLHQYESSWLRHDFVAGLVMTTMLVPVGIAYAEASGLPGINGLYATVVPLLAYALFGPSRILILGPDSSLAAVILTVVLPLSGGEPQRAVGVAGMMAIVSGVVCIAAGLARLGFITELLSKPIRYGYMNGMRRPYQLDDHQDHNSNSNAPLPYIAHRASLPCESMAIFSDSISSNY